MIKNRENETALIKIGTDEAILGVEKYFGDESAAAYSATEVVSKLLSPLSEEVLLRQFDKVTDITIKTLIASALCSQLSTRAIPILEDFTKENYAHSLLNLKEDFYACCIINQIDHPKLSEWKQELSEDLLQREGKNNLFSLFSKPAKSEKVGRNEPCPCGSGKKYKKCCG